MPRPRKPVMFLGGPLDGKVRSIPVDGRPWNCAGPPRTRYTLTRYLDVSIDGLARAAWFGHVDEAPPLCCLPDEAYAHVLAGDVCALVGGSERLN